MTHRRDRDERGISLAVWITLLMPVFFVAYGLGVDLARHAYAEQEAREAAREAARRGTHQITTTGTGYKLDRAAARYAIHNQARASGYTAEITFTNTSTTTIFTTRYTTLFLQIIGITSIPVTGESISEPVPINNSKEVP